MAVKSKTYKLEVYCKNCKKKEEKTLPFAHDFIPTKVEHDYRVFRKDKETMYCAGYMEGKKFIELSCSNCGSNQLTR